MKIFRLLTIVPASAVISLLFNQATLAQTPVIQVSRNLPAESLILNGKSGGTVPSNCGNITSVPSQVIEVTESLPYLRLSVESPGKPTLLIDGPGGRFCVMSDDYSETRPEMAGYWQPGIYSLYVGESSAKQYNYKLSISQQK
ncbi:MAG TPA: hypothetical protein VK203_21065 [Nostocaceae cyanobacterium]|nr:hypothetical protein [Nostocaceae cyanobacterium]